MSVSKLNKAQTLKIVKTLAYVGISAVLGAAIAGVQGQPELFGVYAPLVNVILVTLRQLFTEE